MMASNFDHEARVVDAPTLKAPLRVALSLPKGDFKRFIDAKRV
jgi:hypothetical protein